jgi:hypothetical protein
LLNESVDASQAVDIETDRPDGSSARGSPRLTVRLLRMRLPSDRELVHRAHGDQRWKNDNDDAMEMSTHEWPRGLDYTGENRARIAPEPTES